MVAQDGRDIDRARVCCAARCTAVRGKGRRVGLRRRRDDYDIVVIGGGSAGLTIGRLGPQLGARVAIVEAERLGGDCTWHGCVPSKALLAAGRSAVAGRDRAALGLPAGLPTGGCGGRGGDRPGAGAHPRVAGADICGVGPARDAAGGRRHPRPRALRVAVGGGGGRATAAGAHVRHRDGVVAGRAADSGAGDVGLPHQPHGLRHRAAAGAADGDRRGADGTRTGAGVPAAGLGGDGGRGGAAHPGAGRGAGLGGAARGAGGGGDVDPDGHVGGGGT